MQAPGDGDRATLQQLLQSTGRMIKVLLPAWYILAETGGYINFVRLFYQLQYMRFPLKWAPSIVNWFFYSVEFKSGGDR